MFGNVESSWRSVPKSQLLVVHRPFLPQSVFDDAPLQSEASAKMLKVIHAKVNKRAFREKAKAVIEELRFMKLKETVKIGEDGIEGPLLHSSFPREHWTRNRTNNVVEWLNRRSVAVLV